MRSIRMVVSMRSGATDSFHASEPLEAALISLARAGSKGSPSAVRRMANQLIRNVPEGVADVDNFRDALHTAISTPQSSEFPFSADSLPTEADGAGPLVELDESPDGSNLILPPVVQFELDEIVLERHRGNLLALRGLGPSRSALFSGPPGVGKTLASRWVAEQIGLPLVSLDLAAVLSSYLGNSGRNIKAVLDFAKSTACVLLLDEFDALAKARDDTSDVGELKRIVNVLLVELDRWDNRSFLIAATNHAQLLDPAIGRRFDRIVHFPLPGAAEREALVTTITNGNLEPLTVRAVAEITDGTSPSDLTRLLEKAARRSILHGTSFEHVLLRELLALPFPNRKSRDIIWHRLHREFGLSLRAIADLAGVSHPTVSHAIRRIGI
jgi:MoxR-like ATPase